MATYELTPEQQQSIINKRSGVVSLVPEPSEMLTPAKDTNPENSAISQMDADYSYEDLGEEIRTNVTGRNSAAAFAKRFRNAQDLAASPDVLADNLKLAKSTGIPLQAIQTDPKMRDVAQKRAQYFKGKIALSDKVRYAADNRMYAYEFLMDPGNMALVTDAPESLIESEGVFATAVRGYSAGDAQQRLGRLNMRQLLGDSDPAIDAEIEKIKDEMQSLFTDAPEGLFGKAVFGAGKLMAQRRDQIARGATIAAVGLGAVALGVATGGIGLAPAGALLATGGTAAGVGATALLTGAANVGFMTGAAYEGFIMEAGLAYDELKEFRDSEGNPLEDSIARTGAFIVGAMNAGLEAAQLGMLFKAFPGINKVLPIQEVLASSSFRSYLGAAGKAAVTYASTLIEESATEVLQEGSNIIVGEIAKKISAGNFQAATKEEIIERLTETFASSMIEFSIPLIPGSLMGGVSNMRRIAAVREQRLNNAKVFSQTQSILNEQAQASQLTKRDPGKMREFLSGMSDRYGYPHKEVYIPATAVLEYMESQNLSQEQRLVVMEDLFGSNMDDLASSAAVGADLTIRSENIAVASALDPQMIEALTPKMKAESDGVEIGNIESATEEHKSRLRNEVAFANALTVGSMTEEELQAKAREVGLDHVYLPAEAVQTFYQEAGGEDLGAALDALGVSETDFNRALESGDDIEISTTRLISGEIPTNLYEKLKENMRVEPQAMSLRDVMKYENEDSVLYSREEAAGWREHAEKTIGAFESGLKVQANVKAQLTLAGYDDTVSDASAKIFASHIMRSAERLGIDPQDYFKAYANVEFVGGEAGGDFRQPLMTNLPLDTKITPVRGERIFQDEPIWQIRKNFPDEIRGKIRNAFKAGVVNKDTGLKWHLGFKGIKHIITTAGDLEDDISKHYVLFNALGNLPELAEQAVRVEVHEDKKPKTLKHSNDKGEGSLSKIHLFLVPFMEDDKTIHVLKITGKEYRGGFMPNEISLYDQKRVKSVAIKTKSLNNSSSSSARQTTQDASGSTATRSSSAQDFVQISIREMVSGVKDSEGNVYLQSVYHGSPYKFDRFSLDKIGSGEGARAYGYGLYFADDKQIADKHYRERLAWKAHTEDGWREGWRVKDKTYDEVFGADSADLVHLARRPQFINYIHKANTDEDVHSAKELIDQAREYVLQYGGHQIGDFDRFVKKYGKDIELITGQLFKVDIPDDTGQYLLWDTPLTEQSEQAQTAVRNILTDPMSQTIREADLDELYINGKPFKDFMALGKAEDRPTGESEMVGAIAKITGYDYDTQEVDYKKSPLLRELKKKVSRVIHFMERADGATYEDLIAAAENMTVEYTGTNRSKVDVFLTSKHTTGAEVYSDITRVMGSDKAASEALLSEGIIGNKYLDGNSRADGEGKYNYVLFDDKTVDIAETFYQSVYEAPYKTQDIIDSRYFAAIEADDLDTAQRIVDDQMRRNGYISNTDYRLNHRAPSHHDVDVSVRLDNVFEGDIVPSDFWTAPHYYMSNNEMPVFRKVLSALKSKEQVITMYRAIPKGVKENSFRNGDWITPSLDYARVEGESIGSGYKIIKQTVSLKDVWWDANSINEFGYDDGNSYAYKDTKNNRKMTEAIVRDKNGNIVPPSKRFNQRKKEEYYQPHKTNPNRGSITLPSTFGAGERIQITISPNANASTAVHEMAHFFLWETERLAEVLPGDQALRDDLDTIRYWWEEGADIIARRIAESDRYSDGIRKTVTAAAVREWLNSGMLADSDMGKALRVETHEYFARGFEAYLREGKAPSVGLLNAFRRFKAWLVDIYKSMLDHDVQLSESMKEVFDRMLATEEEVEAASLVGKDAAEQESIVLNIVSAHGENLSRQQQEQAKESILAEILQKNEDRKKERQGKIFREAEMSVYEDVLSMPIYRAAEAMKNRPEMTLSTDSLVRDYGFEVFDGLPPEIHSSEGKASADGVASAFGYGSGDEMLQKIKAAPSVGQEVQARLTAIFGEENDNYRELIQTRQEDTQSQNESLENMIVELEDLTEAKNTPKEEWEEILRADEEAKAEQNNPKSRTNVLAWIKSNGGLKYDHVLYVFGEEDTRELARKLGPGIWAKQDGFGMGLDIVAESMSFEGAYFSGDQEVFNILMSDNPPQSPLDIAWNEGFAAARQHVRERREKSKILSAERSKAKDEQKTFREEMKYSAQAKAEAVLSVARNAVERIPHTQIGDKVKAYKAAETVARKEYREAVKAMDWEKAVNAKDREILNRVLSIEAKGAVKDVAKSRTRINNLLNRTRQNSEWIPQEWVNQIDALMVRYNLMWEKPYMENTMSLDMWCESRERSGVPAPVARWIRNGIGRREWINFTVQESRDLDDALAWLSHDGRESMRLSKEFERRNLDEVAEGLAASILNNWRAVVDKNIAKAANQKSFNRSWKDDVESFNSKAVNRLRKVEFIARALDGGEKLGPVWEAIFKPTAKAEEREGAMTRRYTEAFSKILEETYTKQERKQMSKEKYWKRIDMNLSRENLIAIGLNMGNELNKERVRSGFEGEKGGEVAIISDR